MLSRRLALRINGLSSSRHGQWKREAEQGCPVDELSQCARMHPGQLTPDEVGQMRHMVTAARTKAREARLAANRLRECHDCPVGHQAA